MPSPNVETKSTQEGQHYQVLKSPCSVTLKAYSHSTQQLPNNYDFHHVYVKCSEIKKNLLPLDADPREPDKTPQVKAMQETLANEPEDFVKKNNGVTVI